MTTDDEKPGIVSRVLAQKWRFLKFCLVGGSGVFVNMGCVWLGNEILFVSLPEWWRTSLGFVFGIVVSIFTNFLLNDVWTWRDRRGRGTASFLVRLLKYYAVSAVAAVLQFLTSMGTTALLGWLLGGAASGTMPIWYKWLAVVAGVAVGTAVNFLVNHFWTYRDADGDGSAGGAA